MKFTSLASLLLALVTLGGLGWAALSGQLTSPHPGGSFVQATFTGTSATSDFQQSLEDALQQADDYFGQLGSDIYYTWRLLNTHGGRGGFGGATDLLVKIQAQTYL